MAKCWEGTLQTGMAAHEIAILICSQQEGEERE